MQLVKLDLMKYIYPVYDDLKRVDTNANMIANWLDVEINKPVTLYCRGTSGIVIASAVKRFMKHNTEIVYLRKETEPRHNKFYGSIDTDKCNIVIDDFMSTGYTMEMIAKDLEGYKEFINLISVNHADIPQLLKLFPKLEYILTNP